MPDWLIASLGHDPGIPGYEKVRMFTGNYAVTCA